MNVIQQQLDVSKSLLESLNSLLISYEGFSNNNRNQAQMSADAVQKMSEHSEDIKNVASKSQKLFQDLTTSADSEAARKSMISSSNKLSTEITKSMKSVSDSIDGANSSLKKSSKEAIKTNKDVLKTGDILGAARDIPKSMEKNSEIILDLRDTIKKQSKVLAIWDTIVSLISRAKDAIITGGITLLRDALSLLINFVKTAFNIFTSAIGSFTKFIAFTTTLPFTIAKIAVGIGNQIRTDLVETIQSAGEEAKDAFDLTSGIGKNADKMTQTAKGLLKEFQSPKSRLVKLFGLGATGAASFLKETFTAVADMGHYAEIFGPSILGSTKNGQFIIEMQRAMGIGAQEMAYYALEAYNSGEHPIDTLTRTSEAIKSVADKNDQDFKALTKDFHKLRTNITEFGHLSSNEIANLTGKLREMKVKSEDAINVFKKFTTFEEAAKASAMLFQTFEMNIDAFDLLTARDPGEMLQQFRDAMFQTGRAFKDLNRHEKALMSSITGVSEQGLSSLMNYMDLGLTQDEARKKLEEQDPTKEQTKMIKGLTSTIKLLQKTMTFSSPFEAFFAGLNESVLNNKDFQVNLISLSEIYSEIREFGATLNLEKVSEGLTPFIKLLTNIDETINGQKFKEIMKISIETASNFLRNFSYDIETDPLKKQKIKKLNVEQRINQLYGDLKKLTNPGSELFTNFVSMGGKIVGGIIKGAIYGISAAFLVLAGGVDDSVTALGISLTDEMKADAAKKKIPLDKYSILDWLGISETDAKQIKVSLGSAIADFVSKLPKLISIAGFLLQQVSEVLIEFAGAVTGVLGEMTYEFFEKSNPYIRKVMLLGGFNPGQALLAKRGLTNKNLSKTKAYDLYDLIFDSSGKTSQGYSAVFIKYLEDLSKSGFYKNSPAYNFLNSPLTKAWIRFLKNDKNFTLSSTLPNWLKDRNEPERAQAIIDIAKESFKINAKMPGEVVKLFEKDKIKPEWYTKNLKNAEALSSSYYKKYKSWTSKAFSAISGNNVVSIPFSDDFDDIILSVNELKRSKYGTENALGALVNKGLILKEKGVYKKPKASGVKDLEYTGSDTVLVTPENIFYLDDYDTVLAAKKGGFLNKMFIGLTEYFNETQEKSKIKIIDLTKKITEIKSLNKKMSSNVIERNSLDYEADESDIVGLFDLYDEIIDIVTSNRKTTAKANVTFDV
jgi:hypothetical protein